MSRCDAVVHSPGRRRGSTLRPKPVSLRDVPRSRSVGQIVFKRGELVAERDPLRPSGRLLRQGDMDASYVDLADPRHLEFDYMRWMRIVLRAARARRVLHVGGGACALARALAAEDPAGRQEVCEVDAGVLALAREHLGLRRARGLRVRHAEGRSFVARQSPASWDAVVIDAFVAATVPRRLITIQALGDVARVAPLALVNVVDDRSARDVRTVAAGLAAAYSSAWTLGGRGGNTVVVGCGARVELDLDRVAAEAAADRSPARLTTPDALERLIAGTVPLADQELEAP
jgi:protein-L-isoaspartate O-methyltransferase